MRLTDFDVLTFDMIGTLIDFEQGVLDFARPRLLRRQAGSFRYRDPGDLCERSERGADTRARALVQRPTAEDLGGRRR